jgi:7-cyano-7-deazaguanine synthase
MNESAAVGNRALLLLSGGLDSAALAALHRPALTLFIDYGQRPAHAEARAAAKVADLLGLPHEQIALGLDSVGGGLLHDEAPLTGAPSPEWWPYRNQLLVTAAAAVALRRDLGVILTGTVAGDGARHADGTVAFYQALDQLLRLQEGGIRVMAPAIASTTEELLADAALPASFTAWTVSCHRAALPCGDCPGCWKRLRIFGAPPAAGVTEESKGVSSR